MTRINLVHPQDLADQHLFAEWREIKMIVPATLRSLNAGTALTNIPQEYTLNQGHVKFFYNKLFWLRERFNLLTTELENRNYKFTPWNFSNDTYYEVLNQTALRQEPWAPTSRCVRINVERIVLRLNEKPNWYRYRGEVKPPSFFIEKYSQQHVVDVLKG
jgi:deoxyribonuclease (pyrimidine dimer)